MQAQCHICPLCHDDHHESVNCDDYAKQQSSFMRKELANRIRGFRNVSIKNDPNRDYKKIANECRKGERPYNRHFGMGKAVKL